MPLRLAVSALAYGASLELGRLTAGAGGLPLLPLAAGILFVWLARASGGRQRLNTLLCAAVITLLSAWRFRPELAGPAVAESLAALTGAMAGITVLRACRTDLASIKNTRDAAVVLAAAVANASTSAIMWVAATGAPAGIQLACAIGSARLASDLAGIMSIVPLSLAAARGLRPSVRGRVFEFLALAALMVLTTYFVWASSSRPRPALLAPLYVWATLRFQLAGSAINFLYELTAVGTWFAQRGPLGQSPSLEDQTFSLLLHTLVSSSFFVLAVDLLDRKRTQQLASRVLDGVSDGIVVIDERGTVRALNRSGAAMFGVQTRRLDDAEERPVLASALGLPHVIESGDDVEVQATRSDGTPFPARVSTSSVDNGDERHTLAVIRDLSQQRRTERSLETSEAQLRAVLQALPDEILIHDRNGQDVGFQASVQNTPRSSAPRVTGPVGMELSAVDATALEAARARVLDTRVPEFLEFNVLRNGRAAWLESRLVPLGPDRTLSLIRDVTDHRILQDQLRRAQKLEAIGRLAGGVAHDFNNLLTVIGGSVELVLESMSPSDVNRGAMQDVREATGRATQLTQQLLAFGRRQVLQAEVFDVRQVVRGCEHMLSRLIGEHITLTCLCGEPVPSVQADRGQIEQVLVNLVVNARDAMPGGGHVTLRTTCVEISEEECRANRQLTPGRFVSVSVTDTGAGIPADVMEHIFEPFFTTKTLGRGTGLGLATVYGIVQQSGGFVTVESRVREGTTFRVCLPAMESAELSQTPPTVHAFDGRGEETILLVEDEPAVREIVVRFLSTAGYRVLAASDGQNALDLAQSQTGPLHLLLTDVVMPGLSGPELASILRRRRPHLPVLFMSGYPNDALLAHQLPDDEAGFIPKPFSRHVLLTAIREALETADTQVREASSSACSSESA